MNIEQLEVIKIRANAATQGNWQVAKSEEIGVQIGTTWEHAQLKGCVPVITTAVGVAGETIYIKDNDAEFIAHARQDVPALIAEIERYKQGYEICNNGMYKAFCLYKEAQEKLDAVELAEFKARMEVERLRTALEYYANADNYIPKDELCQREMDLDAGYKAREALKGESNE